MTERKAVIKNADMSEEMQQDAIDCATQVGSSVVSIELRVNGVGGGFGVPCARREA